MDGATHFIDEPDAAAHEVANGAIIAQAFGNFYVITTSGDAATVRRVNIMKGRPPDQVGSVVTTRPHIVDLFDWSALPAGLSADRVKEIIDTLYGIGPFGFRGPAAAQMPPHLTSLDKTTRTTQIIAPGYACSSNRFLELALEATGDSYLYITSCNRSRHQTGAEDEPAHYMAEGIEREFGHEPGFMVLRHRDEAAARARYPQLAPMSTTVLAFHKLGQPDGNGRPTLVVERHGSMHTDDLARIVGRWGFGLELAPLAMRRLAQRDYTGASA